MVTVQAVRDLGGWEGLGDELLARLIRRAANLVALDVKVFGVSPSAEELNRLVELKACALAERIQRVPVSESAGGLSATYVTLQWRAEYTACLAAVLRAHGKILASPIM